MRPSGRLPEPTDGEAGEGSLAVETEGGRGWARGPRPLRRREGVPGSLETPVFIHARELARTRAQRRERIRSLLVVAAVGAVVLLAVRLILV